MAKSVMVTGGAGMIGSNLVKRLVREGWDVYVADNLWRGKKEYLNDENGVPVIDMDTHFLLKDLADYDQCQECIGFTDYVVHLADIVAGIDYVFANQGELFRVNNLINIPGHARIRLWMEQADGTAGNRLSGKRDQRSLLHAHVPQCLRYPDRLWSTQSGHPGIDS